ncbi:MAG: phosphoribosylamine--glycine ligase [Elusimicrobia bacterium]|nr:phosphoribosylamine--glycine ligase [Elusimicrobiota bacterium]MDE2236601.1 phosphoribosylamine--glycine ligase [Elusimicrobiota bacterium]MDE2425196.1 phosphoribosylamine--glycine ligase [Elusimicrobiota bacterium]
MNDVTVLLLGAGAREHAVAWKLAQSPRLKNLYAAPGSDAIARWAQCLAVDPEDPSAVVAAARDCRAKLVFVGPEAPLAAGVPDALREAGFAVLGPGRACARLESSKAFAKDFMRRHGIPTARYEVFADSAKALAAAGSWRGGLVVKADGLAAGKGVAVCPDPEQARRAVLELMVQEKLGASGKTVVLEDLLSGPEVSLLALADGKRFRLLPPSQDHKRLLDGDGGPNTGGMGAYAPAQLSPRLLKTLSEEIFQRALAGLAAEGLDYRGVLYAGLMLTPEGPRCLEFNCRLGDPETQAILPILEEDLLELALACAEGRLPQGGALGGRGACVAVTLASEGYPERPKTGRPIAGLEALPEDALVFHAGTRRQASGWVSAGGRVLTVCARASDVAAARERAYAAARAISFEGMRRRGDIAAKELVAA